MKIDFSKLPQLILDASTRRQQSRVAWQALNLMLTSRVEVNMDHFQTAAVLDVLQEIRVQPSPVPGQSDQGSGQQLEERTSHS